MAENTIWNIAGDELQAGIARQQNIEHQELLQWLYFFAQNKGWSMAQTADTVGVDGSTLSRLFRGTYVGTNNIILPPPAKMCAAIRRLKEMEKVNLLKKSVGRIKTPTVGKIWLICRKAWEQQKIAFIFGEPQIGKSEALKWFKDENNHGNTIYVDLNGATGVQDVYRCFAKALKLGYSSPSRLKDRIFEAINSRMLIIIDEFHQITYAYKKGSSCAMVHAIKAIHDICGCGMVICSTNIGKDEVKSGHDAKLCSQLLKRGTIQLQLPNALPIDDVRAIVEAYKLDFPPQKNGEIWRNFKGERKGHNYCHDIAIEKGINYLILVLQDGNIRASKQKRALTWDDFEAAHETYLSLSAEKIV
ncbi:MAG: ATP-binding protein [Opitutales bacterium]|nr:ATP-binding protein [Opitutales bacterium]